MPGWSSGLCGCCNDCQVCLCSLFCPCWQFGNNANAVGKHCCCLIWFVPVLNCWCMTRVRGEIRDRRGIPGSCCGDLCVHCLCHPCALCQEAQEAKIIKAQDLVRKQGNVIVVTQPK